MTRYLHNSDYLFAIQEAQLKQLVQGNQASLEKAERTAEAEIKYYITNRYNLKWEFTDTSAYSYTKQYAPHDRFIIDYPDYSTAKTYNLGDCAIYNNNGYVLNGTSSWSGTFSNTVWSDLGQQYSIYYALYPKPFFDYVEQYRVGDEVYLDNYNYTAISDSRNFNSTQLSQYLVYNNVPPLNVYPNDKVNNADYKYWSQGVTYSIPIGTLPTDTTYYIKGDNRNTLIVSLMIDMVLFYLLRTISPKNAEGMRHEHYKSAINHFKCVGLGEYQIEDLLITAKTSTLVKFGGNIIDRNNW